MSIVTVDTAPPTSAAERVFQSLKTAIIRADLRPGRGLSEAETAKRYAVSRQPVREAFIRLEDAGLVAIRPYRGTFVRRISLAAVQEGRFVRAAIEVAIARELAATRPLPDLTLLDRSLAAQREVAAEDHDRFMALDEGFHCALAEVANHAGAWQVIERAKAQMDRVRYLSLDHATPMARLVQQHAAIVEALHRGDPDGAEAAMRTHLSEMSHSLPTLHRRHPDLFEPPADDAAQAPPGSNASQPPTSVATAVGAAATRPAGETPS